MLSIFNKKTSVDSNNLALNREIWKMAIKRSLAVTMHIQSGFMHRIDFIKFPL